MSQDGISTGHSPTLFQCVDYNRNKEFWVSYAAGEENPYSVSIGPWNDGDRDDQEPYSTFEATHFLSDPENEGTVEITSIDPINPDWLRTSFEMFWISDDDHELIPGLNEDDLTSLEKALEDWFDSQKIRLV